MIVRFRSTSTQHKKYRELLQSSWDQDTVREVVVLVDQQLREAGIRLAVATAGDKNEDPELYTIPPGSSEILREYLEQLNYTLRLQYKQSQAFRLTRARERDLSAQVIHIVYLLTFPIWTVLDDRSGVKEMRLGGDTDFFDDCRSLLYLCTVHEVLPRLAHAKWERLKSLLRHALYAHASVMWADAPAQQHYLLAEFFDEIGDSRRAAHALLHAFLNTPSDDHDYFTTAYAYWSYLMEHNDLDLAESFALKLYREAPRRWLSKTKELVHEFYVSSSRDRA